MDNLTTRKLSAGTALALTASIAIAVLLTNGSPSAADGLLANQPKSEYAKRRQQLLARTADGIVVILGAREEDFGEVGRFRQKNDFMYLTGVETPAAYLILVPEKLFEGSDARETLFIPPRNPGQERWTGPQVGPGEEAQRLFGIQEAASSRDFEARLTELLSGPPFKTPEGDSKARLYTIFPHGSTAELTREHRFIESVRSRGPHVRVEDVAPIVAEMRKVKSEPEIALLQRAVDITGEAHQDAARALKPGVWEYQLQAALEYAFARNGAERPGFPSIVGSGFYSTVLHYNQNRNRVAEGDLVVIDIGAEYSYYTADITRTYPASGRFTQRQREVYELVLEAQRAAERAFKPDKTTMADLTSVARQVMKSSALRDGRGRTLDNHFIHGLGHWLGMDVHDVGSYTTPIPAGAVFTIEPGIYLPDEKLGVRIEDDYLATRTGLIKLSRLLPSDPGEVERMVSGGGAGPR